MQLTHDFTVPADVDTTWRTFMDLERVGGCFPGATVTSVSEDGFAGTVKVKLGPIALQYNGTGHFLEREDATHHAVIEAKGKDKRGNGTAGATVRIQLSPDGTGTKVDVTTDLAVTGKPAQFGRGVMQDVSDKLLHQFIACIEGELGHAGEPAPEAPAEQVAATTAATATSVAEAVTEPAAPAASTTPPSSGSTPSATPRAPVRPPATKGEDDALDLGATVLPVLIRTYAPYVVVGVIGLVVGWLIGRG